MGDSARAHFDLACTIVSDKQPLYVQLALENAWDHELENIAHLLLSTSLMPGWCKKLHAQGEPCGINLYTLISNAMKEGWALVVPTIPPKE